MSKEDIICKNKEQGQFWGQEFWCSQNWSFYDCEDDELRYFNPETGMRE
jgi:hypothetical protein